jgi:hypothetical protein
MKKLVFILFVLGGCEKPQECKICTTTIKTMEGKYYDEMQYELCGDALIESDGKSGEVIIYGVKYTTKTRCK